MERAPESAIRFDLASRDRLVLSKGRKSLKALLLALALVPLPSHTNDPEPFRWGRGYV